MRCLLVLALALPLFAAAQQTFTINGRVKVESGGLDGVSMVVYREGEKQRTISTGLSKFSLDLDLNTTYVLSFEKDGFVTKKLSFNTKVPGDAAANGFTPFEFAVSMFKQYDGVNTVVFNQPVGLIRYNRTMDDFDYDTDYTKSIQSALDRTMEEVKEKQQEEAKGGSSSNAAADAKKKAAEDKARVAAETAARQKAELDAKASQKAQQEQDEARKREAQQKADADAAARIAQQRKEKEDAEAAKKAERDRKMDEARRKLAESKPAEAAPPPKKPAPVAKAAPPPKPAPARVAVRPAVTAQQVEGEHVRRSADPVAMQEPSPVSPARTNEVSEARPAGPGPDNAEVFRHEELIVEPGQVVTVIKLDNGKAVVEYKKVVRKYGGTFYFKDGRSCTKMVYDQEALASN